MRVLRLLVETLEARIERDRAEARLAKVQTAARLELAGHRGSHAGRKLLDDVVRELR